MGPVDIERLSGQSHHKGRKQTEQMADWRQRYSGCGGTGGRCCHNAVKWQVHTSSLLRTVAQLYASVSMRQAILFRYVWFRRPPIPKKKCSKLWSKSCQLKYEKQTEQTHQSKVCISNDSWWSLHKGKKSISRINPLHSKHTDC